MKKEKNTIIYEDGELKLEVPTSLDEQTVWLTQRQMSSFFDTSKDNISLHIKNICEEGELSIMETTEDFSVVQKEVYNKFILIPLSNYINVLRYKDDFNQIIIFFKIY